MAPANTLTALYLQRLASSPDAQAFLSPREGSWQPLTWRQLDEGVRVTAAGLKALGLQREQRCAILTSTRVEWFTAALGTFCAGGATTTVYAASTPDECAFILRDSGSEFVFAENAEQLAKLKLKRAELQHVKHVILLEGPPEEDGWVISMADLQARGQAWDAENPGAFERDARAVEPSGLATLIYSSGTTGVPKGIELTHESWAAVSEALAGTGAIGSEDLQYLWLPMAHSFGMLMMTVQLRIGFCSAVDGRVDKLMENVKVVRPTILCAVPRIFEKMHARVMASVAESGAAKARLFSWAVGVGKREAALKQENKPVPPLLALQRRLADRLVFSKLRAHFGGRVRFFFSGGAPLDPAISAFFQAAGLLIMEGYGLTEACGASFLNVPQAFRFGTVGKPLPITEVRLAPDGEILLRSRARMRCYRGDPELTNEAIDAEGWLRTGDIGEFDADGFLRITDRKKDLIKTSGSKYVAPQALEAKLKRICPLVGHLVVHGDRRKFCSALVTLDADQLRQWAVTHALGDLDYERLSAHPKVHACVEEAMAQLNAGLASFETIKRFAILPRELSVDEGELTRSLKLRRRIVEKRYTHIFDSFYEEGPERSL